MCNVGLVIQPGCPITGTATEQICSGVSLSLSVIFFCVLSRHVIHGDVSEVGTDQSDRRGSARRASAALIRVVCAV